MKMCLDEGHADTIYCMEIWGKEGRKDVDYITDKVRTYSQTLCLIYLVYVHIILNYLLLKPWSHISLS